MNINLKNKPEWYLDKCPLGKIPALFVDGVILYESLIIAEYLDEKYPQRPLFPRDPLQKAQDRIIIDGCYRVRSTYIPESKFKNIVFSYEFWLLWNHLFIVSDIHQLNFSTEF